jgi:hypothetical protein
MLRALSILLVVGIAGCSAVTPSAELHKKYAEAAREVGVTPVYPPREEFQIGDVYLVSSDPVDLNSSVSMWLGTLDDLRIDAEKFLNSRVVFANTGVTADDKDSGVARTHLGQEDLFSPQISTRAEERVLSLPIAAFPSITTQAGFTASTGLVAAMAAIGFGNAEQTTVTLDFTDVRTYWVPQVLAAQRRSAALGIAARNLEEGARQIRLKVGIHETNLGQRSSKRCLSVAVVTRVFLTREIQYTYRDREIVSAGLRLAAEGGQVSQVAAAPTINVSILKSTSNSTPDEEFEETAAAAELLRTAVGTVGTGNTSGEGGSFSFVSWNARGLTFKQQYQRPVAIGWEGFVFDLPRGERHFGQPSCLG